LLDTYDSIVNSLLLRCPLAGGQLAEQFINYAFRDLIEKRKWSWSISQSQFIFPAAYTTGTATVTNQSNQVTGSGTVWTTAMIGYQFRTSTLTPIYTIIAVNAGTQTITLDQPWGAASSANSGYKIYIAYQIPPTDFHAFVSIWDPNFSWSLWSTVSQAELNSLRGGGFRLHLPRIRRGDYHPRAATLRGVAAPAGRLRDPVHV
jgi:hypothetical protein